MNSHGIVVCLLIQCVAFVHRELRQCETSFIGVARFISLTHLVQWNLRIKVKVGMRDMCHKILIAATLKNWTLVLYGTKEDPQPPSVGRRYLLEPGASTLLIFYGSN
jgi:hypothetical protein